MSNKIKLIIIFSIIIVLSIFNTLVVKNSNLIIISVVLVFSIIAIKYFLGFEKSKSRYKLEALLSMIFYSTLFQVFSYLFGIYTGFLKNSYNLNLLSIFYNVLPVICFIISIEILRYFLNKKANYYGQLFLALSVLSFSILDISLINHLYDFSNIEGTILFLSYLFPIITKNMLLTYTSVKFDYLPNIVYKLIMEIPVYIIPIIPNFNNYITSIINICISLIVLIRLKSIYDKKENLSTRRNPLVVKVIYFTIILLCLIIVVLTCGIFKFYTLSIGSNSMESYLHRGDVVIVEKLSDNQINNIQIGDVLVYNKDNIVVVHRVSEVNQNYFKTKGDNNENVDNWLVYPKDVIGVVKAKVKYIGYPTVWLNEI